MMANSGGYEYDFVDVPLDQVICKICHNPCRDVHLTGCCGAHFCLTCLQHLKKGTAVNKACPMCRIEKFKIFPNKQLDREIKALKVYCVNRRSGCTWSGEINNMKKHISADCLFVDIFCPSKCGLKLKRQCVQLHLSKECPCHCQYCGTTGYKEEISRRHKKHCTHYPIPCPNGCDLGVVPNVGMDAHRKICPLELVCCEYFNVGCDVRVTRRELGDHYKQNVTEHLNLTTNKMNSVIEEMGRAEKKLAVTVRELDSTKFKYNKLESRITNVNKEIKSMQRQLQQYSGGDLVATVPQPITDCAKRKFFECRLSRIGIIIICFLILHIVHVNITNDRLSQTERYTWPKTLKRLSSNMYSDYLPVAPVVFKVGDYTEQLDNGFTWFSPPFFAIEDECQTYLAVEFLKGSGLMVNLIFIKTTPEKNCYWTKDTMFTVELLNQLYNSDHYMMPFFTENATCHVNEERILCRIYFVSDNFLEKKSDKYLKNDNIYLRFTHDRNIYNYFYWLIQMVTGLEISAFEYHAYILWFIIATKLLLEFRESSWYETQFNGTKFALLNKIVYGILLVCFIILILYMLYCIGLFTSYS